MKKQLIFLSTALLLITGCNPKPKPIVKEPIKENNETVIIKVPEVKEPILGKYDWRMNDELISQSTASRVVVVKSKRVLVLLDDAGNILSRHRISLGKNNIGTKLKQGDYKTPEGVYKIIDKRSDPVYYKEILISYPNQEDRERSRSLGHSTGGGITIHAQVPWNWDGHGNDFTLSNDWTEGCMAVTNKGMDTIWDMLPLGTPIEIRE